MASRVAQQDAKRQLSKGKKKNGKTTLIVTHGFPLFPHKTLRIKKKTAALLLIGIVHDPNFCLMYFVSHIYTIRTIISLLLIPFLIHISYHTKLLIWLSPSSRYSDCTGIKCVFEWRGWESVSLHLKSVQRQCLTLLVLRCMMAGLGHPWSDAGQEGGPTVNCTHISSDTPVWCGVYKAVATLWHV